LSPPHPRDLHSSPTRRSSDLVGHRPDPANFNEFVMTFFKALSPERIAYVERRYLERRKRADEFFEREGWRIERYCPHRQADLTRSEEHTSELQSRFDLVCRLL